MATADIYAHAIDQVFKGNILETDTYKMALLGAGYTPNLSTDTHWADISTNEVSGTGYTAGGASLASTAFTLTAANSWTHVWVASTAYGYGDIVRPGTGNGFLYRAVQNGAGTTAGSAPTFPTVVGEVVTDGTVTWANIGYAAFVFTSAAPVWTTATLTAWYAVVVDTQSGVAATEPLVTVTSFGAAQSPAGVNFSVQPDAYNGWLVIPVA